VIAKKLKERIFHVEATPLPDRAKDKYSHRRGHNIVMLDVDDESEKYDTFFEYEEDLANLKPSGEQYASMIEEEPYVVLEEKNINEERPPYEESSSGCIVMEDIEKVIESNNKDKSYKDVVGFEFIQCGFIKADGDRCKRQAPAGKEICSVHKRYIEKHNC
jgi:hypothetical protein